MHAQLIAMRIALVLLPSLAASQLLTVTQYASTCTASSPSSTAIYTSGSSTYVLPLTTSSAVTSRPSPSGTPTPHAFVCPEYNGQNFTSPSGGTYGVHCDIAISGTRLSGIQSRQANIGGQISQQNCIIACRRSAACVALTISSTSCEYYSKVTGTTDRIGFAALVKRASALLEDLLDDFSTINTTIGATAQPSAIALPNNLGSQFGGVDITKGFRTPKFIRPGLWNLGGLNATHYETQTVYYGSADDSKWTYQVPEFLTFSWGSQFNSETIVGETKSDYQRKLSSTLAAKIGFAGFGLEVQDTFSEDNMVETYHKYASIYARQQTYRVSLLESGPMLQMYLSDAARRLFEAGDPNAIVDAFGTHYMSSATFGGMRRFASSLDVRDEAVSTQLGQALDMKFAVETEAGEVKGGASSGSSDATVQKIHDSMSVQTEVVIGGSYVGNGDSWIPSLYRNPSVIDFELASLADLILDPTVKAAVQGVIDTRMKTSGVTDTALALVMWETLQDLRTDSGSRAHHSLSTAMVGRKQGWFTLGQYGKGSYGWDPTRSKGLLIRNIPGSTQQLVKKPDGTQRRWGKSHSYGLYEMTSNDRNYYALSGFYYSTDNAPFSYLETDQAAMVHTSLTAPASDGGFLWNDGGSHARDNADTNRVEYGSADDDSNRIIQLPDGETAAYFFHTNGAPGDGQWRKLDFSKVQIVSNSFINTA